MIPILRFRLGLLGRFLRSALHPSCVIRDNRAFAPFVLGAGLVVISTLAATTFAMFAPTSHAHLEEAQTYRFAFWGLGVALMLIGMARPARPDLWPNILRMTPASLEADADAIITTLHDEMRTLRDIVALRPNPPREAWTLTLRLPSTPATPEHAPFASAHLYQSPQAVVDAYRDALEIYPWRQTLDQVLGKKAAQRGLLALHLRGDTTLSIHVAAISAHDTLRLAAQKRANSHAAHPPFRLVQEPLIAAA